jgi:hypothetical protein
MAETSTTTIPTKTLRPRKRTEGGVVRFRHPSREQQKLYRLSHDGPPRGFLS